MRRHILLVIALCLAMAARGQTALDELDLTGLPQPTQAKALRYWFDDDNNSVKTANGTSGSYILDVSELIEGLHTLHYQVTDNNNTLAYVGSSIFLKMTEKQGTALAKSLRYWFDDDNNSVKNITSAGVQTLDVPELLDGLHTIHYQVTGSDGIAAYVASGLFLKMGSSPEAEDLMASKLMYWFDDETSIQNVDVSEGTQLLDASGLTEGIHTIHYQVLCSNGQMTPAMSSIFLRMSIDTGTVVAKSLRYWFDDEQTATELKIIDGVQLLDASNLIEGLHTVHYQIANSNGSLGAPYSSVFLKMDTGSASATAQSIRYWFDDDAMSVKVIDVAEGTQKLDVSELLTGLHTLNYQLIDSNGKVGIPVTRIFFKNFDKVLADGTNRVTQYQYWLNMNSQGMQTVELASAANPYTLITLLPMQKEPIQSSQFHFEVTDGVPNMYAKNTFRIRFHDAQGYFTDSEKPFVDYNVKQKVEPVGELQATQTFPKVAENDIRWYTIDCERGDSITLQCSQASSIQAFAPSSVEEFRTNGYESTNCGGFHTEENGTYYIAIHDAKGLSQTMSLNYQHIDKFDLRNTSKPEFGVLPCVQIMELDGNGFDNLESVIFRLDNKEIIADSIACYSKSKAKLYFLLNGDEPYGKYDLILNFDDGEDKRSITREEYVTFMEASFDDIEIAISDPRSVADPYPVHITVTNRSNICYQAIPFYFAIDNINQISSIKYMNFSVTCSRELYENGLKLSFEYDNFEDNQSKTRVVPTIIPELLPGESKTYTLGVKTGDHRLFNVYAWTGRPWNLLAPETKNFIEKNYSNIASTRALRRAPDIAGIFDGCEDDPCDLAGLGSDLAECACGTALGLGGTLGGIQNALQNQHNRAMRDQLAQSGLYDDPEENFSDQPLPSPEDLLWYWLQHCMPGKAGQATSAYNSGRQMLGDDPCQDPPPHSCNPYNPGDPNEIFGYMAESGSKYIRQDIKDVSYTIEFENDPEIANASAHKIVVRDTLDINVFDTSTFKPTNIKIGNKVIEPDGEQNFVKTIDMRPEIDAIAQVQLEFNQQTGIIVWIISSLDPMSMDETFDIMQGVLPVNNDGNGIGYLSYDISLKNNLDDGNEIMNRAGIVFDYEEAIITPTWTNIVDAVPPTSTIGDLELQNDTIIRVNINGSDARSGIWKYELYVQHGQNAPWWKEGETDSTHLDFRFYEDIDYGFCVLATDSAGNVEKKVVQRERGFKVHDDDYEDTIIERSETATETEDAYDISGRKVGRKAKGIIIRNNNGSIRKVLIK